MAILRLKTDTQQSMIEALIAAGIPINKRGKLQSASHSHYLMMIGELAKVTGAILIEDDFEYPEMQKIEGYHANLITEKRHIIEALKDITQDVKVPIIKVAGEIDDDDLANME